MTIAIIADELFRELERPSEMSVPSIGFWLRNHIGDVNNLLSTSYEVSSDSISIVPELGEQEKSILKKLFNIYYYETTARRFLGAAAVDVVLELSSDGGTIRTVNKNEISKSYLKLQKEEKESLDSLVRGYRIRSVSPLQVAGDDTVAESTSLSRSYNRTE